MFGFVVCCGKVVFKFYIFDCVVFDLYLFVVEDYVRYVVFNIECVVECYYVGWKC